MKKIFSAISFSLWLIIFLCVSISGQTFRTVEDGVEYAEMTRGTKEEPVRINLLKLDLTKVRLDVVHAMDAAIGLERTSSIATRYGALAAVNAGFFRLDTSIFAGDPTGVLKIDRTLLSEPYANRVALFISNKNDRTEVVFDNLNTQEYIKIGKSVLEVSGINRERKENELIVFTPEFNRSTLTNSDGLEVTVENDKITSITVGKGSSLIPPKGFVFSASGKMREQVLKFAKIGRKVSRYNTVNPTPEGKMNQSETAYAFEDIVGGVPQLIKNGRIEITWEKEKSSKAFVETRHPRTAVAQLKDGKFLMVTVDGRQPGVSVGMNLNELAAFLLEMGATDAMNLDGGGSTTMFLDGKIVNKPSDKEGERRVSDAILIFPRRKN